MTKKKTGEYPGTDETALVRASDKNLHGKLTGKPAVDSIAEALRNAEFEFDADDLVTIATADDLAITDADEYSRGYDLLSEISDIEKRITAHYATFGKPLTFLTKVVRDLKNPQLGLVQPIKATLARRIGAWKTAQEVRERAAREKLQVEADRIAREAQEAKAKSLERVASTETDPDLIHSFVHEADMVRSVPVRGAPVEIKSSIPVSAGHTRKTWKCDIVDLRQLMRAWLDGKCHLDEKAIVAGLNASMNRQASVHQENLTKAFPGTIAVSDDIGVTPRR